MSENHSTDGNAWFSAILTKRSALAPVATDYQPRLSQLTDIRAVIFDVYGTLVVSGSGDVGSADESDPGQEIVAAIHAAGIEMGAEQYPTIEDLHRHIHDLNDARRSATCPKPEVDIVDVWRRTLLDCGIKGASTYQVNQLAAEYEARANPTWPMPGAIECLQGLTEKELKLGIVSNAQAFTLPLVQDLGGTFGVNSVFDSNLCVFSNRYRQAKPGPLLFKVLCRGLKQIGIEPHQAIYVGNDRLNDVWAATQAGLRTAWFVGDRRSARDRRDDPRMMNLEHDVILTELTQLLTCLAK